MSIIHAIKERIIKGMILPAILLTVSMAAASNNAEPSYNISTYGAVGDGKTLNTQAIQSAIDKCTQAGGGVVVIPPGQFLSGTILMKSNVELHLSAGSTLLGNARHEDYPTFNPQYRSHKDSNGFNALIYAENAENISLTGIWIKFTSSRPRRPKRLEVIHDPAK